MSTFFVNTGLGYDGIGTLGATGALAVVPTQAVTALSVGGYRLVSSAIHVIPQASVLNQAGSIHAAMPAIQCNPMVAAGVAVAAIADAYTNVNRLENSAHYNKASVSAMEGIRQIWMPVDGCALDFLQVNSTQNNDSAYEYVNAFVIVIVGAGASAPFRIDLYQNFEITPVSGSILQNMESLGTEPSIPSVVWQDIALRHEQEYCQSSKAVNEVAIANLNNSAGAYKRPIINMPQIGRQPPL